MVVTPAARYMRGELKDIWGTMRGGSGEPPAASSAGGGWRGGAVGSFVCAGDVVEVVVHADEAGNNGVTLEVDGLGGGVCGWRAGDAGDLSVFDEEVLVFEGCSAGAVDDAHVREEDGGGVDFDVLEDIGGKLGGLSGENGGEDSG